MTRIMEALQARAERIKKGDKGFTLIELLVVVIIIGILAAIAIPVYIGVQNNAKDSAVKSDLGNAKTAVVSSFTNTGTYPTDLSNLKALGYPGPSTASNYVSGNTPAYIGTQSASAGFCIAAQSVTNNWFYVNSAGGVTATGTTQPTAAVCVG